MTLSETERELPYKISVCGRSEIQNFKDSDMTHLLSIDSPGSPTATPGWFTGVHRHLAFADVESRSTAFAFGVEPPGKEDVRELLALGTECLEESRSRDVHLVIHCLAGVSRSPGAAYSIMCMLLGPGYEEEAFDYLLSIRSCAWPNKLIVKYADQLLNRDKAMIRAVKR